MGGAEGVVDVDLGQGRELIGEGGIVLLLPGMEAEVLEQDDLAGVHVADQLLDLRADAVAGEADRLAEQRDQLLGHRQQGVARIALPLGAPEMGGEDHHGAGAGELADRRDRLPQPGRVDHLLVLGEGDVEIHPHEDALAFQMVEVEIVQGQQVCHRFPPSRQS